MLVRGRCDRDMSTPGSDARAEDGAKDSAPPARDEMPDVLHLYRTGALDQAEARCRAIVEREPDRGAAWDRLARIAERRGQRADAEAHYRRAIATLADPAEAHNNLAVLLQRRGELDDALDHYRHAIALGMRHALLHSNLGCVLRGLGRLEESAERVRARAGARRFAGARAQQPLRHPRAAGRDRGRGGARTPRRRAAARLGPGAQQSLVLPQLRRRSRRRGDRGAAPRVRPPGRGARGDRGGARAGRRPGSRSRSQAAHRPGVARPQAALGGLFHRAAPRSARSRRAGDHLLLRGRSPRRCQRAPARGRRSLASDPRVRRRRRRPSACAPTASTS